MQYGNVKKLCDLMKYLEIHSWPSIVRYISSPNLLEVIAME